VTHAGHGVVKIGCGLNAFRRHSDHSFGPPAALRSRIAHPCFDEALGFQTVESRIERPDGAVSSGCSFDLLPYRRTVSAISQPRGGCQQQVFELTQHYYHIVMVTQLVVKLELRAATPCSRGRP